MEMMQTIQVVIQQCLYILKPLISPKTVISSMNCGRLTSARHGLVSILIMTPQQKECFWDVIQADGFGRNMAVMVIILIQVESQQMVSG